jgi:hypothetical protein
VLEGQALVTAAGETATVPEGAEVSIALDDDLLAQGAPGMVLPYAADNLRDLPLILLDRAIEIAAPLATVCTVTMPRTVNIRTGPGTDYPIETRSTPGALFHYVGQTRGTDGYIWYLTACGFWVREDLIPADCSFVPDVSPSK